MSPVLDTDGVDSELMQKLNKILALRIASPNFNIKIMFSTEVSVAEENCEACSVTEGSLQ